MIDRSWHASIAAPDGWGPGPWDYDLIPDATWVERSNQFGNIRAWAPSQPTSGGRIISMKLGASLEVADRVPRRRESERETVLAQCWCGRSAGSVPTNWVREGRTCECDAGCRVRGSRHVKEMR